MSGFEFAPRTALLIEHASVVKELLDILGVSTRRVSKNSEFMTEHRRWTEWLAKQARSCVPDSWKSDLNYFGDVSAGIDLWPQSEWQYGTNSTDDVITIRVWLPDPLNPAPIYVALLTGPISSWPLCEQFNEAYRNRLDESILADFPGEPDDGKPLWAELDWEDAPKDADAFAKRVTEKIDRLFSTRDLITATLREVLGGSGAKKTRKP
jgi:hypothetical protein